MNINIETHSLFTEKVWTFKIPDHATWKSHINNMCSSSSVKQMYNCANFDDKVMTCYFSVIYYSRCFI